VIGVLDLHSRNAGSFNPQSAESQQNAGGVQSALQVISDQIAAAVNNNRLIATLERTVSELGEARGQQTIETWRAFIGERRTPVGYRFAPGDVKVSNNTADGLQALQRNELASVVETGKGHDGAEVNIPIRLRERTIGVIRLRFDTSMARPQVEAVAEEVAARLALLLESARLLDEAQHRAQREQQINVIATEMRSAVDLEGVLQNTVRELGKALGARRTFIQLGEYAVSGGANDEVETASGDPSANEAEA